MEILPSSASFCFSKQFLKIVTMYDGHGKDTDIKHIHVFKHHTFPVGDQASE